MTAKDRRVLFFWAVALFLFLSATVLVFAFGFKYDFENHALAKTGSIVLNPNTEAEIFINGRSEGLSASLLSNAFSKKRLLPGKYIVRVEKENYFSWQKEVEVKEGLVSDFSKIVLFGRDQAERIIANGQSPLSVDQEGQKAAYWDEDIISFYDLGGSQPLYQSGVFSFALPSLKVLWGNGKEAIVYDKSQAVYFDLVKKTFLKLGSPKLYSLENSILNNSQLYVLKPSFKKGTGGDLSAYSIENSTSKIIAKSLFSFLIAKNEIFALTSPEKGINLLKMDLRGDNTEILADLSAEKGLTEKVIKKIENREGAYYFLIGSNLYTLHNSEIVLMAANVGGFAVSPDSTVLGWHSGREFWVEWIKDVSYQPMKKSGEKELIAKVGTNIDKLGWYKNSNYGILELADGLLATEIDLRGGVNSYTFLNLAGGEQAWYDLNQNKIYKLSGENGLVAIDAP